LRLSLPRLPRASHPPGAARPGALLSRRRVLSALGLIAAIVVVGVDALPRPLTPPMGRDPGLKSGYRNGVAGFPSCPCQFEVPPTWWYDDARQDLAKPRLGFHSYDAVSADHASIPTTLADMGVDWSCDPGGALYQATVKSPFSPLPPRPLTVAGQPAVSFAHWTAPPTQGGLYEQQVYVYIPQFERDYHFTLLAANPPGQDVGAFQHVFNTLLTSFQLTVPNDQATGEIDSCVSSQPLSPLPKPS